MFPKPDSSAALPPSSWLTQFGDRVKVGDRVGLLWDRTVTLVGETDAGLPIAQYPEGFRMPVEPEQMLSLVQESRKPLYGHSDW